MVGIFGNRHAFWQALIFTIIVFSIGLILGFYMESSRASTVEFNLLGSEVNLLDSQLRGKIVESSNLSCDLALGSTFTFADKVYEEALKLEKYDSSSKFNKDTMLILHRRYDLLRTMFWFEAINLKKRCPSFHTVVYFFNYNSENIEINAKQAFFSNLLRDLKNKDHSKILLIPIAANLDLSAVEIAMQSYNVTSYPSILIDENKVITDRSITFEQLDKEVFLTKR